MAPSYQTTSDTRKHARGIPVRNKKVLVKIAAGSQPSREVCSARGGDDAKSVRAEDEFLSVPRRTILYWTLLLSEATAVNSRGSIGSPLISNRSVLQAEGLLPVLLLHDLGAQIADSVDNAPKRGAHLGLKVAIVEATLFECTLRRFDA
jgi:hypothetical protein